MDLSGLFNKPSNMSGFHNAFQEALEAAYAPLTKGSKAASQMTYASLMGPQFMAKLLENKDIASNLTNTAKANDLAALHGATGMNRPGNGSGSIAEKVYGGLKSLFGDNEDEETPLLQTAQTATTPPIVNNNSGSQYDSNGNNITAAPTEVNAVANKASPIPEKSVISNPPPAPSISGMPVRPQQITTNPSVTKGGDWAQNIGSTNKVEEQGTQQGKNNSDTIKELTGTVFNGRSALTTLGTLGQIVSSPQFEQMRTLPLSGHLELAYFAKEGTPAQQQMVGNYITNTNAIIKDSSRDFAGQFRQGEQTLLSNMKLNDSDTVDTARGKLEALTYMQKMLTERAARTAKIMADSPGVIQLDAMDMADKQINGSKIRQQIHDDLNPKITIRRKTKTGWENKVVTPSEARAIKAKGIYNG